METLDAKEFAFGNEKVVGFAIGDDYTISGMTESSTLRITTFAIGDLIFT